MCILHVFDHSLPLRSLGILAAQRGFGGETIHVTAPHHNEFRDPVETVDGWTFHRTPKPLSKMAGAPIARELMEMRAVAVCVTSSAFLLTSAAASLRTAEVGSRVD
jgi:hypothetical protein